MNSTDINFAIDVLSHPQSGDESDISMALDIAIKSLKAWRKALEQEPKWIPVSERLPKAGEYIGDVAKYYLIQNEYGDMLVARYRGKYWQQIYRLKPIGDEIVAWMPLPEPYKAESEDKE